MYRKKSTIFESGEKRFVGRGESKYKVSEAGQGLDFSRSTKKPYLSSG